MIIPNGTLTARTKSLLVRKEPYDGDGYPVAETAVWRTAVPCQIIANTYNALGRSDGEHFTTARYTVLVDGTDLCPVAVRLTADTGENLGEFPVMSVTRLTAVYQTQIIV